MTKTYLPHLLKRGIRVRLVRGKLRLGPKSKLNDSIIRIARRHKSEILVEVNSIHRNSQRLASILDSQGWCKIYSSVLKDIILIIRDENVEIPKELCKIVAYTLAELKQLRFTDPCILRDIHRIKSTFGGRVDNA